VGDGERRRDELDRRGQGGDRARGEREVPMPLTVGVPLEDSDVVADDVRARPGVFAEAGNNRVEHAVTGHVSQPDPGRVVTERGDWSPHQRQVARSFVLEY